MYNRQSLTQPRPVHSDVADAKPARPETADAKIRARHFMAPLAVGIPALGVMFAVARIEGLPIRDPDARYVGSPLALIALIVVIFVALDVLPRAVRRARSPDLRPLDAVGRVFGERWWGRRGLIVVVCILGFYATYLAYRNLKSFLPFATDRVLHDSACWTSTRRCSSAASPPPCCTSCSVTGSRRPSSPWSTSPS